MARPELQAGNDIDIRTVDDAVRFLTRHQVTPPTSYRGAYLVEHGDGSVFKLKLEGFYDSELREIHDRVTGSRRRRNPGRRDANVYHPAPDDTQLRRDGTPFPRHCKHGLAPPKACHTCHPQSDCETCAELRENPCKGWRSPPRERDNPRAINRPPRDNPGLHDALNRAAKRAAMTGAQPSSGEVADWIRQYPKTWRQMVARYSR